MTTKATTSLQNRTAAQRTQQFPLISKSGLLQSFSKVALSPKGGKEQLSNLFSVTEKAMLFWAILPRKTMKNISPKY